jgi:hypothetical protein
MQDQKLKSTKTIKTPDPNKLKSIPKDTKSKYIKLECMQDQKLKSIRTKKTINLEKLKSISKDTKPQCMELECMQDQKAQIHKDKKCTSCFATSHSAPFGIPYKNTHNLQNFPINKVHATQKGFIKLMCINIMKNTLKNACRTRNSNAHIQKANKP